MSRPKVAVLGVGHMGRLHAQKLAQLAAEGEVELVAVCDHDAERAALVAAELGVEALADPAEFLGRVDAVCVAVPTTQHHSVSEPLLRGGIDVLVEKPIALTREEARSLIETARRGDRILQVGHIERFSSAIEGILPFLSRPRFIEAHRIGPYPARGTDVSVVLDLMIHDLDIVAHLARAEVDQVDAVGVAVLSSTEDIANARVRFANGCILNITASRVSAERIRKIRIFQADAYISIDLGSGKITVLHKEGDPAAGDPPKILSENLEFDSEDALLAQDRAFIAAVRDRSEPRVGGEDGYRALDLALRIQESIPPLEDLP